MFKVFFILVVSCFFCSFVKAQWNWVNPKPESYYANKIVFINDSTGFIINNGGSLLKTTDQGTSWHVANRFGMLNCLDIFDSTAVVAGYFGTIYVSCDNATSWQKKITGISASITGIDIVSRDTIFLSSANGLYRSVDRGQTWGTISLPVGTTIKSFDFINNRLGFVGKGSRSILKTDDGGQTWVETATVDIIPSEILSIKFLNKDTGYAFRSHNYLLKTINGGISWTETLISDYIFAMSFPSDSVGYLAGQDGAMYRTTNAGNSWQWMSPLQGRYDNYDINSMYFINNNIGFATGEMGRIIKTVDGGRQWEDYSPIHGLTDFIFPDAATGYISNGKTIYKTIDSGKIWNELQLSPGTGSDSYFQKVYFFSPDTGFVTSGEYVRVHQTTDGGQTWSSVNPAGYYSYPNTGGISFFNDSTGFITLTSSSGYMLAKTKDRGHTWKGIDSARFYGEVLSKIHFLDEKTGYGLRYNKLYKTTDSTKNWVLLLDNQSSYLTCLWFIDERIGFVADDYNNGFRRTTDSGITWSAISLPNNDKVVLSIKFINSKLGYITCSSGSIYQSADSGASWSLFGKIPYECDKITVNNKGLVYFGGKFGTIVSASTNYIISTDYKCLGSSISFTSDITGSSYLWERSIDNGQNFLPLSVDGIHSGVATNKLSILFAFPAWQSYKYRCLVDGVSHSKEFQFKLQSHWTGALDNDWNNPGNWSCGSVPDSNTDVLIGIGKVLLHSNSAVRSLTIIGGATLSIEAGYELKIIH